MDSAGVYSEILGDMIIKPRLKLQYTVEEKQQGEGKKEGSQRSGAQREAPQSGFRL